MKSLTFSSIILILIMCGCTKEGLSISFDSNQVEISEGESITLTVTSSSLPAPSYSWVSNSPNIATVNNGIVTGKNAGTVIIKVTSLTDQSVTAECTVIVKITGTSDNPYLINSVEDLKNMRDSINNGNAKFRNKIYKLMTDLDFVNEHYWEPIGISQTISFKGTFDGNGKVIKNIKIGTAKSNDGLFGYIDGGNVKDLGVQWSNVYTNRCLGGIAGTIINGSKINNCYSTGDIVYGGIAKTVSDSEINNCFSTGNIAAYYSGGIAAIVSDGSKINNCYSTGDIAAYYSGGIVGYASNGIIINNCYSTGDISSLGGLYPEVGGIAGHINGSINKCYSIGNIKSNGGFSDAGGIAGIVSGFIYNCYSTGNIVSDASAGGIAAGIVSGSIYNCYSTGSISCSSTASSYSGGIAGYASGSIFNCYSTSTVSAFTDSSDEMKNYYRPSYAGGIAGYINSEKVNYCIALNKRITASGNWTGVIYYNAQIANLGSSATASNNYAYGSNNPVDLLNAYVAANPTYNGVTLSKWKVQTSVNGGYPIFQ